MTQPLPHQPLLETDERCRARLARQLGMRMLGVNGALWAIAVVELGRQAPIAMALGLAILAAQALIFVRTKAPPSLRAAAVLVPLTLSFALALTGTGASLLTGIVAISLCLTVLVLWGTPESVAVGLLCSAGLVLDWRFPSEFRGVRLVFAALPRGESAVLLGAASFGHFLFSMAALRSMLLSLRRAVASAEQLALRLKEEDDAHRRDLSELNATRERMTRDEKLNLVGRVVGGFAHDLNNHLTVILANVQSISPDEHVDASLCDDVCAATQNASLLVRRLLTFGRRGDRRVEPLELVGALKSTARVLRRLVGADIALAVELQVESAWAMLDPAEFEQVVFNLVLNARDALGAGGQIDVSLAEAENGGYTLAVSDNGSGMDSATISRVFEPFFSTKEAQGGTGLGLANVRDIVNDAKGHIKIESEQGRGSRFTVWFPALEAPATSISRMRVVVRGRESVLVVEDDPQVRQVAVTILSMSGYQVHSATSIDDALERIAEKTYDVVLSDVVMPGRPLSLLVSEIDQRHSSTCLLVMSGYSADQRFYRGNGARPLDFLAKPFTRGELLDAVETVLATRRQAGDVAGGQSVRPQQ